MQRLRGIIFSFFTKELFAQIVSTYLTRIIATCLGLAVTIITTRTLGPEGRGWLANALACSALATIIASLGLPASNLYYASKEPDKKAQLTGNSIVLALVASIIMSVFLYAGRCIAPDRFQLPGLFLPACVFFSGFTLLGQALQQILLSMGLIRDYNLQEILFRIACLVLSLILLAIGSNTPLKYFFANILAAALAAFWCLRSIKKHLPERPSVSWNLLKACACNNVRSYLFMTAYCALQNIDILMVQHYLGPSQTGLYNIGWSLRNLVLILPGIAGTMVSNRFLKQVKHYTESIIPVTKWSALIALVTTAACLILAVAGKSIISILFGQDFVPGYSPLLYSIPGIIIGSFLAVLLAILLIGGVPWKYIGLYYVSTIINVILGIEFIPSLGINGAGLSYSLTMASQLVMFAIIAAFDYFHSKKQLAS